MDQIEKKNAKKEDKANADRKEERKRKMSSE